MSKESPVQKPFACENNASVVDEAANRNKKKKRKKSLAGSLSLSAWVSEEEEAAVTCFEGTRLMSWKETATRNERVPTAAYATWKRERERKGSSGVRSICREDPLLCGSEAFGTHPQENTSLFPPNPTIRRSYLQSSPAILKHLEREDHLQAPIIISPAPTGPNCCSSRVMRGGDSSLRCCSIPLGNGGSCRR
jgi:hypothetical protein